MKAIIAAGGTGGHINPGIAIANMLKENGYEVKFVGTEKGLETDLVPKAGYEIKIIKVSGLKRKLTLENIKVLLELKKAIKDCVKLIEEEKPDIVIGTGGYVTAPLLMAGIRKKVPTFIHESNALPGKTTKMLAKKVDCIAVGFEDAISRLPKAKYAVCTGNPTRMKYSENKDELKKKLGIEKQLILVFGGSQGAQKLNETMIDLINNNKLTNYSVIYATGKKHYEAIKSELKNIPENIKVEQYIYNMEEVMNAADLVVSRSGALTISEISLVGVPSILIPFPYAAENHQYYNAKALEKNNAAVIIEEKDLTSEKLLTQINILMNNKNELKQMGENARMIACDNAIENVKKEIEKIV